MHDMILLLLVVWSPPIRWLIQVDGRGKAASSVEKLNLAYNMHVWDNNSRRQQKITITCCWVTDWTSLLWAAISSWTYLSDSQKSLRTICHSRTSSFYTLIVITLLNWIGSTKTNPYVVKQWSCWSRRTFYLPFWYHGVRQFCGILLSNKFR